MARSSLAIFGRDWKAVMGMEARTGAVTFLFTDVEGSTRWWEEHPAEMGPALRLHDGIIRAAVEGHRGDVFATGGDGFAVAFNDPADAVQAALEAQDGLGIAPWRDGLRLRVRMGIHTGSAEARDGDYFGPTLNRAARLMAAGHGGQILVSESTRALLEPEVWSLQDLGRHRLKDVTHPQQIFQVGTAAFEPLRSIRGAVGNLARERTSFIGRERLIEDVVVAIEEGSLVTLAGVGGVGKTRLAIEVAFRFAESSGDGAWLCTLADAQNGGAVVDVVASALRVQPEAGLSASESLVSWLSNRQLLLVLDNCEHVIDAVADLVEDILDGAPNVRVLATSREGLALAGERLFAVSSLALPKRVLVAESEAVQLFIARARDISGDFEPRPEVMETIGEICRRLDGIPLAIELAAARLEALSPADILGHLDQRFELLTGGRSRRRERHQTLRHTVGWSYDLLDATEQAVFRRLSVFAASFELDAAVEVGVAFELSTMVVVDTLTSLCRKSLVQIDHVDGQHRYRYLETIRAFAEELNEQTGELDAAMAALTAWFVSWAEAFPALFLACRIDAAYKAIDVEEPNLRRVLTWAADHNDTAAICALFAPFGPFIGWGGERVAALANEYAQNTDLDDEPDSDAAFALAAFFAFELLDHQSAVQITERGFANATKHGGSAFSCQAMRWLADFLIGNDVTSRSRVVAAAADASAQGRLVDETRFLTLVLNHDAIVGDLELVDAEVGLIRQRAIELDAPLFEMQAELAAGMGEKRRDLDRARVHLRRATELDGVSPGFIGTVITQETGAIAILLDDDRAATRYGTHVARYAYRGGRLNFIALAAVTLTGPLTQIGDAEFAAEILGWASGIVLFDNFWIQEIKHATKRVQAALSAQTFEQRLAAGAASTNDSVSARLLDRLSTIEALTDNTGHEALKG